MLKRDQLFLSLFYNVTLDQKMLPIGHWTQLSNAILYVRAIQSQLREEQNKKTITNQISQKNDYGRFFTQS